MKVDQARQQRRARQVDDARIRGFDLIGGTGRFDLLTANEHDPPGVRLGGDAVEDARRFQQNRSCVVRQRAATATSGHDE
jgi:hypothetical protein